jgi:hypothetical protein
MSRAVIYESFGGPEVLDVKDVPEPHAGAGLGIGDRVYGGTLAGAAADYVVATPAGAGLRSVRRHSRESRCARCHSPIGG